MPKYRLANSLVAVCLLIPAAVAVCPEPAIAQTAAVTRRNELSDTFFTASQLRASGQRVARLYLESGLGMRPNKTRILLEQEAKSLEQALASMKSRKDNPTLARHTAKVAEIWTEMRPLAMGTFNREQAESVYDLSEQFYIQSSKITYFLEDQADSETGYLADLAGRNAALSERIAKASFLFALTHRRGSLVDFETWKKEYVDAYEKLEESRLNDSYAQGNLKLGRMMWQLFDTTISAAIRKQDSARMIDIAKCADGMWEIAQSSKKQYEVMFRQQQQQGGQLAAKPIRKGA